MSATFCLPHLALVLALSALPTLSIAQTPPVKPSPVASPSKDTVLFDFEGGQLQRLDTHRRLLRQSPRHP